MKNANVGMVDNITVLYEDTDVMVVNKPAGLLVHEDGHSEGEETVVTWLLGQSPDIRGVGEFTISPQGKLLERSGVVHRLDRDTSGVLVLAKNQTAHAYLKKQFHDRDVKKEYRAFVYGVMKERWGTIDRPIGRSPRDFRLRSAQVGASGTMRPAITHWECIGSGEYKNEPFSYMRLHPKTGRTHQLRVHLKAIDRSIVGDVLYAAHKIKESNNLDLKRLALHAHVLQIHLPNGMEKRFIAPVPQEFEEAAERIAE